MRYSLKQFSLVVACFFIVMVGIGYAASDIPALREASSPEERARIQGLIDGARAEGKLEMIGVTIEPSHFNYLMKGLKAYYGLPNLAGEFSFSSSSKIVTRVEQLIKANRPTPDIIMNTGWPWFRSAMTPVVDAW